MSLKLKPETVREAKSTIVGKDGKPIKAQKAGAKKAPEKEKS